MRKFLLIGGNGTVGRNLQKFLQVIGEDFLSIDSGYADERCCDIRQIKNINKFMQQYNPTHVIHLAASVGRVHNEETQQSSLEINCNGTHNVVLMCLKYKAKMVYVSTSECYGEKFSLNSTPVVKLYEFNQPTDFPFFRGIYGLSKLFGEKLVFHYNRVYNLDYSMVRLFMCYAADGSAANEQSAVSQMMRAAIKGNDIIAHRDTSRSWCYVDDIVQGIYLAATKGNRLYNIGKADETISSVELAQKIRALASSGSRIIVEDPPRDIYRHKNVSTELAEQELGFKAHITLDEGLEKVYEAFRRT